MASGKKSKQARRAAAAAPARPPVSSKGGGLDLSNVSRRTWTIVGGVALLVVIGIALAVTLGGGGGTSLGKIPTVADPANGLPGATDISAQFKGIPEQGLTLGRPGAPVTMTEYIDLQCPFCQQFETEVLPTLLAKYVRKGKLKIVARPINLLGDFSLRGQRAMIAAANQNKAFEFSEITYANQGTEHTGWLTDDFVASAGESVAGMNPRQLVSDLNSAQVRSTAAKMDALETSDKVSATPTIYVGKTGTHGALVNLASATDTAGMEKAIDAALAAS